MGGGFGYSVGVSPQIRRSRLRSDAGRAVRRRARAQDDWHLGPVVVSRSARIVSLDWLRAVAVLLVLGRHMDVPEVGQPLLQSFLVMWRRGGWVGVDLFFVLSGFLVAGLLFREFKVHGRLQIGRFLVRRGLKLHPAFYGFLMVTLIVEHARGIDPPIEAIVGELLYLQNYVGALWNHTWTLAVEEHFYLALTGIIVLLARRFKGTDRTAMSAVPFLAVVVMGGCLALRVRLALLPDVTYSDFTHLYPTHLRIDSLMFGVLMSYYYHFDSGSLEGVVRRIGIGRLFAVGALLLLPPFLLPIRDSILMQTLGLTTNYLAGGAIVLAAVAWERGRQPAAGLMAIIGVYSYSIYIWHLAVKRWGLPLLETVVGFERGGLVSLAVFAVASIVVGATMAKLIEMPVLRIRDRFFPSRSAAFGPQHVEPYGPRLARRHAVR